MLTNLRPFKKFIDGKKEPLDTVWKFRHFSDINFLRENNLSIFKVSRVDDFNSIRLNAHKMLKMEKFSNFHTVQTRLVTSFFPAYFRPQKQPPRTWKSGEISTQCIVWKKCMVLQWPLIVYSIM